MLGKYLELQRSGHFSNMPHHYMRRDKTMDYLLFWVLGGRGFVTSEGKRHEAAPGEVRRHVAAVEQEARAALERVLGVELRGRRSGPSATSGRFSRPPAARSRTS